MVRARLTRKQSTSLAPAARLRSPAWAPCVALPKPAPFSAVLPSTDVPVKAAQPPPASCVLIVSWSWLPSAFVATVDIA